MMEGHRILREGREDREVALPDKTVIIAGGYYLSGRVGRVLLRLLHKRTIVGDTFPAPLCETTMVSASLPSLPPRIQPRITLEE